MLRTVPVMLSHLHHNLPQPDADGAAMDTPLPPRRGRYLAAAVGGALLFAAAALLWRMMPQGLSVDAANVRVAVVGRDTFHDDVLVRALVAQSGDVQLVNAAEVLEDGIGAMLRFEVHA